MCRFSILPEKHCFDWLVNTTRDCSVAKSLFEQFKHGKLDIQLNTISCNSLLSIFNKSGVTYFQDMLAVMDYVKENNIQADFVTYSLLIRMCVKVGSLEIAKQLHSDLLKSGIQLDIQLQNALISMYGKYGCLEDAQAVFDEIPHSQKNIVSWNAMIAVLGSHGLGQQALELFKQLEETGLHPDEITFMSLLNALSHSGMVNEGFQYYDSMQTQYSLIPTIEHQNCIVDLLGRSGQLERAEQFIINQIQNSDLIT
jgi:pentatricopeptide repeat protein